MRNIGLLAVCLLLTSCSSEEPRSTADEERLRAELGALPLSTEGPFYTDAAMSLPDWTTAVNEDCRDLVDSLLDIVRPDEAEGADAITSYVLTIQDRSEQAYKTIAARTPPVPDQPRIKDEFLRPYFEQLNASQRLQRDFVAAGADQAVGEQIISEATDAKRRLTVFAAKNGLTDCIN